MNSIDSKIRKLGDLLRGLSPEARDKIYRVVAEKLLGAGSLPEEKLHSLLALYDALAPRANESARAEIAQRAVAGTNTPEAFVERLATDSARVAATVLKRAPMSEETLLNVIASTPHSHHLVIAERGDLTDRLREALTLVDRIREPAVAAQSAGPADRDVPASEPVESALDLPPERMIESPSVDWHLEDPPHGGFRWRTDREGRLSEVSPGIEGAFGKSPDVLHGVYFFSLLDDAPSSSRSDRLSTLVAHRQPLRDVPVLIDNNRGQASQWKLRARSRFERSSGRFSGYDGIAVPSQPGSASKKESERQSERPPGVLNRLEAEARDPLNDTITAACRLADRAKVRNDYDSLGDAAVILEDAHRLREMIEDATEIAGSGASHSVRVQTFGLLQAIREALKDDAVKRGGISRFRIRTSAMDAPVKFDRDLFRRYLGRMLDAARRFGSERSDRTIGVSPGKAGFIDITVPISRADGRLAEGDIFLSKSRLEAIFGAESPTIGPAFTPSVSLTVLRPFVKELGGEAGLRTDREQGHQLVLSLPIA